MNVRHLLFGLAVTALSLNAAVAEVMPTPKVDYSADRVFETPRGNFTMKVYASEGKERSEMDMGRMKMITIIQPKAKKAWTLMPLQKIYQELDLDQAAKRQPGMLPDDHNVDVTAVGHETINGVATTKYKLAMKDQTASGFVWVSEDGITMKMDMLTKAGGDKNRVQMELRNLKLGKQDADLFAIPAGYTKMPSMAGALGGMGAAHGALPAASGQ